MAVDSLIKRAKCLLLFFDSFAVLVRRDDTETTIKQIDWSSVIRALESNYSSSWHFGELRLHKIINKGGRETTICSLPPTFYELKFEKESIRAPLPGIVLVYTHPQMRVFAYIGRLSADSTLYRCPLPNVGELGTVCWGNLTPPKRINKAWQKFIASAFNRDFDRDKSQSHPVSVVDKLRSLTQTETSCYPETDLIEAGFTLNSLLATLKLETFD